MGSLSRSCSIFHENDAFCRFFTIPANKYQFLVYTHQVYTSCFWGVILANVKIFSSYFHKILLRVAFMSLLGFYYILFLFLFLFNSYPKNILLYVMSFKVVFFFFEKMDFVLCSRTFL